jgi:hypothetical protein
MFWFRQACCRRIPDDRFAIIPLRARFYSKDKSGAVVNAEFLDSSYHGGSQQGASAMMLIAPDSRAGVVVLINSDAAGASELASQLLEIVLGLPRGEHKEITVDPKLYDGYVGSYEVTSVVISILREGDHLFAQLNGHKNEIFPESVRDYFFKAYDSQITFVTGGKGRATELILHEGGTDVRANRIK